MTASPPISLLGFDPLLDMPDESSFVAQFCRRTAPIKVRREKVRKRDRLPICFNAHHLNFPSVAPPLHSQPCMRPPLIQLHTHTRHSTHSTRFVLSSNAFFSTCPAPPRHRRPAHRPTPAAHRPTQLTPTAQTRKQAVLLDQTVAAGVGNWIADEVLYHSRLHPEQPARSLTHAQLCTLRAAMHMVGVCAQLHMRGTG